ncbi:unnamed protein product [Pseudo-nitzschia multistriata]|uniref:Uncharacterized protein n=1 Tax=Pseudo-nitzschia multistriata TaxID=183589 RepID=A0A448YUG3_9STRA|nr:unnamed protein product [Pseudo-nitzschia multistriata]
MSSSVDDNATNTSKGDGNPGVEKYSDEAVVQSFVDAIPHEDRRSLDLELDSFVVRHASHHRPIALVSSGGTAADLEINSVRCLDNFSTGKRGAISVEEFLKRGYAVIHLWRKGSASPYGRVLSQLIMGKKSMPNEGISMASLGKLFATGDLDEDQEDQLVQAVLDAEQNGDPWLSDPSSVDTGNNADGANRMLRRSNNSSGTNKRSSYRGGVQLHRRILNSTPLLTALNERKSALEEGRILTIPFRSVEDYLAKLQLSSESLRNSQALAIFYLAAAVSDFYVPLAERSQHKIQSRSIPDKNSGSALSKEKGNECLNLKLWPVPKVMGLLRSKWAPDAFICSFKLETDKAILRQKAEGAIDKYGCHVVIGNLLATRHDQVWILAPADMERFVLENSQKSADSIAKDWPMHEISRPKSSETEVLEGMIIENVVQTHFEYISTSLSGSFDKSGTASVMQAHYELQRKKKEIENELFWNQVQKVALDWAGVFAGAALSYVISAALRRRIDA